MKIAVLAVSTNIHTIRWVNAIAERGVEVVLLTQQRPRASDFHASVTIRLLPFRGRFAYALNAPMLRILFDRSGADLLHVQYAGGYGVMSFLSGVRRRVVSVWGGDVYVVPYRTRLHRLFIVAALRSALRITSTSHVMAQEVRRLGVTRPITVIPFGVDTELFRPEPQANKSGGFVVGTVKTLQPKYGVDTLIRGFVAALADPGFASLDPVLRIAGTGSERARYEALAEAIGRGKVHFEGHVEHAQVPALLRTFDIYVALSREHSESFGVAIIEASACAVPVIVSDVGGLPEVVAHGETGLVIPRDAPMCFARALASLALDPSLRRRLGSAGRSNVMRDYEWSGCVDQMIATYGEVIAEEEARTHGVGASSSNETVRYSTIAPLPGSH